LLVSLCSQFGYLSVFVFLGFSQFVMFSLQSGYLS
jgi:hypothetical protein